MHWIYLIHKFHNLSWITEINNILYDILIYWDAPVYVSVYWDIVLKWIKIKFKYYIKLKCSLFCVCVCVRACMCVCVCVCVLYSQLFNIVLFIIFMHTIECKTVMSRLFDYIWN